LHGADGITAAMQIHQVGQDARVTCIDAK
jgi:hypothetical protein